MAESAVTFLVHKLSALLHGRQKFLEKFQEEIGYIMEAFEKMKAFSRSADAKDNDAELQLWIKQVQDLAQDVQDILEKHVVTCSNVQEKGSWSWKKPHHHSLMSEKLFEAQNDNLSMLLEGIKARIIVISLDDDAAHVGIENDKSVLLDWLLSDDPEWKLYCVIGSRGIGKTTLVKKVYDDASVKKHFNCIMWIEVSRFSTVKELLRSIITPENDQSRRAIDAMDDTMLAEFIQQVLELSRYFVVLDDVPGIGTWRALKGAFPIGNCGSRVIIMSCSADIHTICLEPGFNSHFYDMKPLSEEESWILFCRKAFSGSLLCPPSLVQISKDIIEKCNGLPMAILVIAGALATKGNMTEAWEMFYESLVDKLRGSYSEDEYMQRVFNLCYQDLPFYLKSCFTYLSIIPKYYVIDKMRLIRLLAAQGFVLEREEKAIAQVADSYLNELANRSLIQVAERYSDGRLDSFTIHSLWYESVLSKSSERVTATIANGEEITRRPHKIRHLVIHDQLASDIQDIDQFKHLHSLITLANNARVIRFCL